MTKRLLMISFDAVADRDIPILMTLPNFSRLLRRGTLVREVESVFVTNTYPTHTTIQTGVYPCSHKIMDNTKHIPGAVGESWNFLADQIRVPSLISESLRAGKKICSVLYPVTGGAPIRWHFPEIAGELPTLTRALRTIRYGRPGFVLLSLLRFGKYIRNVTPESLDRFTAGIAARAIARHNPDLTMVHLLDADGTKHIHGPDSKEAEAAIHRLDDRLGELLDAVERTGNAGEYSILVFSDHGCLSVHTTIEPSKELLAAEISPAEASCQDAGGTCFFRIDAKPDTDAGRKIERFLRDFAQRPEIEREVTAEEMRSSGASELFTTGFVAKEGFSFGEVFRGQHGYSTDRPGYHTFYLAVGNSVPEGRLIQGGRLIDICPLAIDLLGLPSWRTDGRNAIL